MKNLLTKKQEETFAFVKSFFTKHKEAPTITELAEGLGLKSFRSVTQRLEQLEKKGLIKRDSFKRRGISVLENQTPASLGMMRVPVIASAGCDATEIYSQSLSGEYLMIDRTLAKGKTDVAIVKAVGGSMLDAGIRNGDYVLVEVTENVSNDDRVVALIGDMAVIKKYRRTGGVVVLQPEASGYDPIMVTEENSRIFGKVLSVIPMSAQPDDVQFVYDKDGDGDEF